MESIATFYLSLTFMMEINIFKDNFDGCAASSCDSYTIGKRVSRPTLVIFSIKMPFSEKSNIMFKQNQEREYEIFLLLFVFFYCIMTDLCCH